MTSKKIGILGSGMVGLGLGSKFIELGHSVMIGSRTENNEKSAEWKNGQSDLAHIGTFEQTAQFGDLLFIATKGEVTLDVVKMAGIENLSNKILIDISNPLDFSKGFPPHLIPEFQNTTSLGEEIQKIAPDCKVIKTLNTVNVSIMTDPNQLESQPTMFICGNDESATKEVEELLKSFGWNDIIILGDITNSRALEALLPLWIRLAKHYGMPKFGFKIVK
jgi:predicted dinucleotide-binding enzyme